MGFDIGRLRRADWFMGGGAVAFFIILFFFKWYGASYSGSVGNIAGINLNSSVSGWKAFTDARWIWIITILVALAVVAATAVEYKLNSPVSLSVIVAALGALSVILIIYRIIHHPGGSFAGVSVGIKYGIWFGLIAAAVVTYGGYLGMQSEGTSLSDVRDQATRAVSAAAASAGEHGGSGSAGASESAPVDVPPAAQTPPESSPPAPPEPAGGSEPPLPPPAG